MFFVDEKVVPKIAKNRGLKKKFPQPPIYSLLCDGLGDTQGSTIQVSQVAKNTDVQSVFAPGFKPLRS